MRRPGPFLEKLLRITAVVHVVPALAVATLAARAHVPWPWLVGIVFFAVGVGMFVPRARAYLRGDRRSAWRNALLEVPYFVHWTAGLLALACAVVLVPAEMLWRRALVFPGNALVLSYALGAALAAWGAFVRRHWFTTRHLEIPIASLDPGFDGYRIAHLSDLHIGPFTPVSLAMRWVRAVNLMKPDLIVVTGDMVVEGTAFHEDVADVIGALSARDGVVVALGNHDYTAGAVDWLVRLLRARGARVLRNQGELLQRGIVPIYLAGMDDSWSNQHDMDAALLARPDGVPTILLAHNPIEFPKAAARGVDLTLSGHTHGGQIALPLMARHFNFGRFTNRHTLGVYRDGKSALVVHPGLGTSGPPVRVGVAPAIVMLTLRAA